MRGSRARAYQKPKVKEEVSEERGARRSEEVVPRTYLKALYGKIPLLSHLRVFNRRKKEAWSREMSS